MDGLRGFFRFRPNLVRRLQHKAFAHVAQLVEHILGKDEVTGSNPVMGSIPGFTGRNK